MSQQGTSARWWRSRWAVGVGAFALGVGVTSVAVGDGGARTGDVAAAGGPAAVATVTVTAEPEPNEVPTDGEDVEAEALATRSARPPAETYLVSRVVDGDTIDLGSGATVRVVGIDTPETGECGYDQATAHMERLVLGERVVLGESDEDRDRYGRLLRYVDVGQVDAGLRQIQGGFAIARYDSRDGYGYHPREDRYIAADRQSSGIGCEQSQSTPASPTDSGGGSTSVYYDNCAAAYAASAAPVYRGDPGYGGHLDGDGDGVGCE